MKVLIVMGSDSDFEVMKDAAQALAELKVDFEATLASAHRSPDRLAEILGRLAKDDVGVIIAGAGGAAHLAGAIAARTTLPVIGVPISSSAGSGQDSGGLGGLDALLSTVQMPAGVPVATVAIDGARNAALLAAQILALSDPGLRARLAEQREMMAENVAQRAKKLEQQMLAMSLSGSPWKD